MLDSLLNRDNAMMNFKIVTDSGCDMPFEKLYEQGVDVIGMAVNFNGKEYIEDNWKSIDAESYYTALKEGATPTTSQITPARFYEFFSPYLDNGMDVLYVGFSSSLSGTFGAANVARNMLKEDYPDRRVELIDTMSASVGVSLLVLEAAKMQKKGSSMDEIMQMLEEKKFHVNHIFTVDDLNHLKRGGRVSSFSAAMGTMLSIKPILYMSREGKLLNIEKAKGRKKSLHILVDYLEKGLIKPNSSSVLIAHGNCPEDVALLEKLIREKNLSQDITSVTMGMTIGAHTGANVINMVFFGKDREETLTKA